MSTIKKRNTNSESDIHEVLIRSCHAAHLPLSWWTVLTPHATHIQTIYRKYANTTNTASTTAHYWIQEPDKSSSHLHNPVL